MRDIIVFGLVFAALPFIVSRPWLGILMWCWLSYMNPHRLAWGWAHGFGFAEIVAVVTIVSVVLSRESWRIPMTPLVLIWFTFIAWMGLSTYLALVPDVAQEQYIRVLKIHFITFLTIMVMNSQKRLTLLLAVIVVSIGFFGIKGGIFTILQGGGNRVWGPPGTVIEDNNALAVALLMVLPLMHYLRQQTDNTWLRRGLLAGMVLVGLAALGTYSRGALVAGTAMLAFFWLKSHKKIATAVLLIILVPPLIAFMPEKWTERVNTMSSGIERSGEAWAEVTGRNPPVTSRDRLHIWPVDASAMGRLNAWNYAINVANARVTGGGLESWSEQTYALYAPIPESVHSSHSIYFSTIADHGWFGLFLFLLIGFLMWRTASKVIERSEKYPELKWLGLMCRMVQVGTVAYASGGAFLSLAYFDLYWHFVSIVVIARRLLDQHVQKQEKEDLARQVRTRFGRTALPVPARAQTQASSRAYVE
jgi:putative inorganic carbon (hco3(-)) transporter